MSLMNESAFIAASKDQEVITNVVLSEAVDKALVRRATGKTGAMGREQRKSQVSRCSKVQSFFIYMCVWKRKKDSMWVLVYCYISWLHNLDQEERRERELKLFVEFFYFGR